MNINPGVSNGATERNVVIYHQHLLQALGLLRRMRKNCSSSVFKLAYQGAGAY
ncbi:hypothetical protein [Pontibacter brevis]